MTAPLLLDEMLSGVIADQLRARNHDVLAVAQDLSMTGLPDNEIFAEAVASKRALVTLNIRDFMILEQRWRSSGRSHSGLVLVSSRSFPQNRSFVGALVNGLDKLLTGAASIADATVFLHRDPSTSRR